MQTYSVACGHPLTASAAVDVLHAGGNAVDAAIAAALMATVAEPVLASLLGGGFLTIRADRTKVLDFFVQTPRQKLPVEDVDIRTIEAQFGTATQTFHIGAGTIATPGVAQGLSEAHTRFGRIPFAELAAPAAQAAREGVEITNFQAQLGQIVAQILSADPAASEVFCADGKPLPAGAVWKNAISADVLETFANEGPRFVSEGEVAEGVLSLTTDAGHLTAKDLRAYAPVWRDPLSVNRGSVRLLLNPPPALGGTMVGFPLSVLPHDPDVVSMIDALKATSEERLRLGIDADRAQARRMLSGPIVDRVRESLAHPPARRGTTHVSIIDRDGIGAALTLSNGTGCGMIVPGTGIMANNMLGEEDLLTEGLDRWEPDQRMASMMTPMAVNWPDGRFAMLGSGGSNRIRSALTQVVLGLVDRALSLDEAICAPRVHLEGGTRPVVNFEDLGGEAHRDAILAAYPEATPWPEMSMFYGGVHGVMGGPKGATQAAGDPRRAGCAIRG